MPRISVCIPSVRPTTLRAAIASIRRQTWTDWELFVVGQGEDESVREAAAAVADDDRRVRYLHSARQGVSAARNAGFAAASGDIVALMDDDCEARPDWLAVVAECFAAMPDIALVGGALLIGPPRSWRDLSVAAGGVPAEVVYDPSSAPPPAPAGFDFCSANLAVRRDVPDLVGPFDEFLGPGTTFPYAEDIDYKLRLEAAGVKMLSTPRSVVSHTYGRRYGLRNVVTYWHQNESGIGAVAAKLTLRGDPRGRDWVRDKIRTYTVDLLRRPTPQRALGSPVRLPAFLAAYRRCLRDFELDPRGLLTPRRSTRPLAR